MTPAIRQLEREGVDFTLLSYPHDPRTPAYGDEAAQALGLDPQGVFKTLVARLDDGRLVMAMVPVSARLDLKALARTAGARKATLADAAEAERATGYVIGGISPLGQKRRLAAYLDASAKALEAIHVSGGRRGLELRLAPGELIRLSGAQPVELARR